MSLLNDLPSLLSGRWEGNTFVPPSFFTNPPQTPNYSVDIPAPAVQPAQVQQQPLDNGGDGGDLSVGFTGPASNQTFGDFTSAIGNAADSFNSFANDIGSHFSGEKTGMAPGIAHTPTQKGVEALATLFGPLGLGTGISAYNASQALDPANAQMQRAGVLGIADPANHPSRLGFAAAASQVSPFGKSIEDRARAAISMSLGVDPSFAGVPGQQNIQSYPTFAPQNFFQSLFSTPPDITTYQLAQPAAAFDYSDDSAFSDFSDPNQASDPDFNDDPMGDNSDGTSDMGNNDDSQEGGGW